MRSPLPLQYTPGTKTIQRELPFYRVKMVLEIKSEIRK